MGDRIGVLQSIAGCSCDQEKKNTRSHHVESKYFTDTVLAENETQHSHGKEQ